MDRLYEMKIKFISPAISLLLLSLVTATSYAEMYVSGAVSLNDHGYEIDGDVAGYTLGIGYRPRQGGFGGEIDYLNTSTVAITGLGNLQMSGVNYSVVYWIPSHDAELDNIYGYVKVGIYDMTATVASATADSMGWTAGMGFEFRVRPNLGLYADVNGFLLVDATNKLDDNLTIWSLGVRYYF